MYESYVIFHYFFRLHSATSLMIHIFVQMLQLAQIRPTVCVPLPVQIRDFLSKFMCGGKVNATPVWFVHLHQAVFSGTAIIVVF